MGDGSMEQRGDVGTITPREECLVSVGRSRESTRIRDLALPRTRPALPSRPSRCPPSESGGRDDALGEKHAKPVRLRPLQQRCLCFEAR